MTQGHIVPVFIKNTKGKLKRVGYLEGWGYPDNGPSPWDLRRIPEILSIEDLPPVSIADDSDTSSRSFRTALLKRSTFTHNSGKTVEGWLHIDGDVEIVHQNIKRCKEKRDVKIQDSE